LQVKRRYSNAPGIPEQLRALLAERLQVLFERAPGHGEVLRRTKAALLRPHVWHHRDDDSDKTGYGSHQARLRMESSCILISTFGLEFKAKKEKTQL
jgi:hypothetical protein